MAPDVRIERSIESLAPDWDELADRVDAPPFLRPGWFAAWSRAFGAGELELIALRRGDRLAGVLPLERRHGVLRGLANYHSPLFGPLTEDREVAHELLGRALAGTRRRLSLALLDETDATAGDLRAAAAESHCRTLSRPLVRTPVLEVEGDWDSQLARLSRRFRKELRRLRRRLEELGTVEVEIVDGSRELARNLGEFLAVEGSGWKAEARTSILSQPQTRRFYEEVAEWAGARGMLRLFLLRLDGSTIAADYTLEHNGVRFMLKGGFDPRYAQVAPGALLLEAGLAHAFRSGLARVELGGGDEAYKLRWTEQLRVRALLQVFPRTPLGLSDWATFTLGRPIAKRFLGPRRGTRGGRHAPTT